MQERNIINGTTTVDNRTEFMLLFKDIKQNYPVYILDTQEFSLIQGKIISINWEKFI